MLDYDVVVIDTGINTNHQLIKKNKIEGISFLSFQIENDILDEIGHGTAVYSIIRGHDDLCTIFNLKAFQKNKIYLEENELLLILTYIYNYINCRFINLSMGINIVKDKKALEAICNQLLERGTIIISAFNNNGGVSYPAAFPSIIGVASHEDCRQKNDCIYIASNLINVYAHGNVQRLAWTIPQYVFLSGNSFACAHITGILSKEFGKKRNLTLNKILEYLQKISIKKIRGSFYNPSLHVKKNLIDKYKQVAIYPFNKEMHSLFRFEDKLKFKITEVYDSKYSLNIGGDTNRLLGIKGTGHIIKNINNIEWDSFNTIIIGHTSQLLSYTKQQDIHTELIMQAIQRKKYIYSFDKINLDSEYIFYPQINYSDDMNMGMMYQISKPVVGVFGTSSGQGKFTLQLFLRYLLMQRGYKIGQLGSEPTALLFGMDECVHFGYNNTNNLSGEQFVLYINQILHRISEKDIDIIISGCQSQTISQDFFSLDDITLRQYEFLIGLQPDAVILCVNPYDQLDYIKRTISFLESSVDSTVICIVVFPMDLKNRLLGIYGGREKITDGKYLNLKKNLENETQKNVYNLNNMEDLQKMVDQIIVFF